MIIGIDYTAAAWQGAGIGRYTRELVRAAIELGGDYHYRLFYAAGGLPVDSPYVAALDEVCRTYSNVSSVPIPLSPHSLTRLWQRLRLPIPVELFTGRLNIVHAPDFVLPPTRARTLLTVHDLAFLIGPQWSEPKLQRYLARTVPRAVRRADLVLADSYATRDDLVRLLHVDPAKTKVIHLGADPRFRPLPPDEIEAVRQRVGLPERFIFFISTLEPRKNLVRLLEAFALAGGLGMPNDVQLVIGGRKGWLYDDIFTTVGRLHLGQRVRFLDFLDDRDLPALYNLASVYAYVPLYEGFGLTALEAMACGTPVITSGTSSLPEVVGDAALMVDPYDQVAIARGLAALLTDDALRARLRVAGPQQAARFSWRDAAQSLLACYNQLADLSTARPA